MYQKKQITMKHIIFKFVYKQKSKIKYTSIFCIGIFEKYGFAIEIKYR